MAQMTAFTDEDLKRFKYEFYRAIITIERDGERIDDLIDALLARLDCAEKALDAWQILSDEWHSRVRGVKDEFEKRMVKAHALQAWQASKGAK